jgi:pimeloyl-ACP methyl ester carboxylesterase
LPRIEGLDYEEHGGGTQDPPLVFLHGAGGNRLHWPPGVRRLEGVHTFAVDLPGHGKSPAGGEVTIDDFAGRVAAWRRSQGIAGTVLVGHSMGSAIALTVALGEPEALAGLVLIGAGPSLPVNPVLLEQTARAETFADAVERILRWSFAPQASPRLLAQARRSMLAVGPAILHRDLQACDAFDVAHRLAEVRVPTLIIVGSQDRMTPPRLSEALHQGIGGSRLHTVEGAGHMVMLEQPAKVALMLRDFRGEIIMTSQVLRQVE